MTGTRNNAGGVTWWMYQKDRDSLAKKWHDNPEEMKKQALSGTANLTLVQKQLEKDMDRNLRSSVGGALGRSYLMQLERQVVWARDNLGFECTLGNKPGAASSSSSSVPNVITDTASRGPEMSLEALQLAESVGSLHTASDIRTYVHTAPLSQYS